jgi:hypothetical protein
MPGLHRRVGKNVEVKRTHFGIRVSFDVSSKRPRALHQKLHRDTCSFEPNPALLAQLEA